MSTQDIVQLSDAENGHVPVSDDVPDGDWDDFREHAAAFFADLDAKSVSENVPVEEWPGFNDELDACIAANEGLKVLDVSPTATSPDQAHDLGDSPVRGSTSSFQTNLSPGSEHEEDTDSNLGSELTPEEWAELNGEAPPPPPSPPPPPPPPPSSSTKSKSRKTPKARTAGGKKKKGKSQLVGRRDVIAKLREDTIRAGTITSLDRAITHIQSKVAAKTRQIFIDNSLSDIVMHGQTEAEDMTTDNDVSALPKVYHTHWRGEPNYRLLAKHMDLHNDVKLNDVYISLGLNVGRGKDLLDKIKQLLAAPGCSLRVDGDLTDEHKILVAELAHELLAVVGWGHEDFQRPTLTGREDRDQAVGQKTWGYASTDIFLGFCKLLYKAAKFHEGRRKGANRRTHNAGPAVPEPSEPQQQPLLAEPPAPAPVAPVPAITITAPSPSAPRSGPSHVLNHSTATNKRPHIVLDLTSDDVDDGGVGPGRPPKRARTTSTQQQTRQFQHVQQRPPPFVPLAPQTIPQSPRTLEQPQQMTNKQRQIKAQVEAYQRLMAQRSQALPQQHHQIPQHDDQQQLHHQIFMSQQYQQNSLVPTSQISQQRPQRTQPWPPYQVPQQPHTLPRNQMPQQPRALPQNYRQSAQRPQGLPQFQAPQGPQMVPQFASPQRPEGLARQFHSPQRPQMAAPQFPSPQRPEGLASQFQMPQRPQMMAPQPQRPQRREELARQFQSPQRPQVMGPPPFPSPQRPQGMARQFQSPQRPQMMATPQSQATQPPPWAHLQSTHNDPPRP